MREPLLGPRMTTFITTSMLYIEFYNQAWVVVSWPGGEWAVGRRSFFSHAMVLCSG